MRRARGLLLGLGVASAGTLLAAPHARAAEPMPARAERVATPGRTVAGDDSSDAIVLNPANMALAPGAELRWTGVRCPDTRKVGCGHAFGVGIPLPFDIATGLRVDWVMPPGGAEGAAYPFGGSEYAWLTWGLAVKLGERGAIGGTIQRTYSSNSYLDGLFGVTAGLTYRPYTRFAFAAVARDFNGPAPQLLLPTGQPILDRSYALAMAYRPTGTRAVEVGVEARYLEATNDWIPRAAAVIEIPGVGRARGEVEVRNLANDASRGILATAGLEMSFGGFGLGGGALFGSGLGTPESVGEYATVSIASYSSPGVRRPQRAVWLRMESTPGTRGHVALLRRLWRISERRDVAAVTMLMRAEPAASYAHAEELADAFRLLRARGKKVLCSFEDAGPKALYACASADRIVVNPAGGLHYAGLKTTYFYLARLLSNVGVKADFVRIGAHKSAPEMFMNDAPSDVAKADQQDLLRQFEAVYVKNLSLYRKLPEDRIRAATAKGPFVATEAREAGFVDGTAFDDELERVTQELVGSKVPYDKWEDETHAPEYAGPRDKVGLLYVDGDIVDGRSRKIPLIDMSIAGSYTIAEAAKKLREDPQIKSVVLRIESPGGSALAADVMWRELKLLAEKKPLIVSMGSVAASGGYYVAAPGRKIFALPLTMTGSIGVFYGKADASELLRKVGISVDVNKTTPRADAESFYRGFTDDERRELDHKVHQFYDVFVSRVAEGRHLTAPQVDEVGQGRVWTGQQAVRAKLVDELGGLREALAAARFEGGLPHDSPVVDFPPVEKTLIDRVIDLAGARGMTIEGLPVQVRDMARAVAPLAVYSGEVPLARAEWVPLEDTVGRDDDDE